MHDFIPVFILSILLLEGILVTVEINDITQHFVFKWRHKAHSFYFWRFVHMSGSKIHFYEIKRFTLKSFMRKEGS
jgi:hypothetical protein